MSEKNSHRKSRCEFAEETVAFLYGEVGAAERPTLAKHFEKCPACAGEIAAFGSIRSSIHDWREDFLDNVEPPLIVIPYENGVQTAAVDSVSWLDRINRIFDGLSLPQLASAAFAVLAIVLGLVYVVVNYAPAEQTARLPAVIETNESIEKPGDETPVITEKTVPEDIKATPDAESTEIAGNRTETGQNVPRPEVKPKNSPERYSNKSVGAGDPAPKDFRPDESTVATDKQKPKGKNEAAQQNIEELIISNFAGDEEDETLRLADLFDEVGSGK